MKMRARAVACIPAIADDRAAFDRLPLTHNDRIQMCAVHFDLWRLNAHVASKACGVESAIGDSIDGSIDRCAHIGAQVQTVVHCGREQLCDSNIA